MVRAGSGLETIGYEVGHQQHGDADLEDGDSVHRVPVVSRVDQCLDGLASAVTIGRLPGTTYCSVRSHRATWVATNPPQDDVDMVRGGVVLASIACRSPIAASGVDAHAARDGASLV